MQEAYRIGVSLALKGNVSTIIEKLTKQFGDLDRAIKATQTSTTALSKSMETLGREGRSAAQEWQKAAAAMERAARAAASSATRAAMRPPMVGMGYGGGDSGPTQAAPGPRRSRSPQQAIQNYVNYGLAANVGQARLNNESSTQFRLVGPPSGGGPGRSLVPVPGTEKYHDYARSPDRGALVFQSNSSGGGRPNLPFGGGLGFGSGGAGGPIVNGIALPPTVGGGGGGGGGIPLNYRPPGAGGGPGTQQGRRSGNYYAQGVSAYGGFELLKSMYEASAEIEDAKRGLENQGFSIPEVEVIAKKSDSLRKSVPGTSIAGNMAAFSKAQEVFQNTEEAIAATPEFIRFDRLMTATNHTKEGQDILSAFRLAEFRGAVMHTDPKTGKPEIDVKALKTVLDMVAASALMTNADIGPRQVLQSLRSAGTAGALVDNRTAFVDMMAMQIALGQSKAGTSLQGFAQQFVFGRQSKTAIDEMIHAGIIKGGGTAKTNPFVRPMAMGQYLLLPGAMPEGMGEKARDQPVEFVEHYLRPVFQKVLASEFGKKYTEASPEEKLKYETATTGIYASRLPGSTFMAESIRNYLLVERDREANKKILERGIPKAYETRIDNNPMIQQQALSAAYKAFLTHLGDAALQPAIAVLNDLTKWLDKIGEWAKENPDGARKAIEAFAGGLALFAAGTGAAIGLAALTGAGGLVVLASGIEGLGKALTSIPGPLIDALAGAALGSRFGPIGAAAGGLLGLGVGYTFGGSSGSPGPGAPDTSFGTNFGFDPAMYGINPNKPNAPVPSQGTQAAPGTRDNPVYTHMLNGRDLLHGTITGQGSLMNRPQDGPSGTNLSLNPAGAWQGSGGWAP